MDANTEEYLDIKNGDIFVITDGDYSDYTIIGMMKAYADFNIKEARKQCMDELTYYSYRENWIDWTPPNTSDSGKPEPMYHTTYNSGLVKSVYYRPIACKPSLSEFMNWLDEKDLATEIEYKEIHDYGMGY